jgi:hypothetical protein
VNEYVTLDELKASAELTGFSFADYDAKIALTAASRGIDEYCDRRFWDTGGTTSRVFTPLDSYSVSIDDAITVGTVEADTDGDGVYETAWAVTDYQLAPFNAAADGRPYEEIRARPWVGCFPCWAGSVRVTGRFGWPDVPSQVKEATTIMATRLLKRAREAPFGVAGIGADNTAVRIARVDPDVAFLIDPLTRGQGVMVA